MNPYFFYSILILTLAFMLKGIGFGAFFNIVYALLFGIIILNLASNPAIPISLENPALNYLGKISREIIRMAQYIEPEEGNLAANVFHDRQQVMISAASDQRHVEFLVGINEPRGVSLSGMLDHPLITMFEAGQVGGV